MLLKFKFFILMADIIFSKNFIKNFYTWSKRIIKFNNWNTVFNKIWWIIINKISNHIQLIASFKLICNIKILFKDIFNYILNDFAFTIYNEILKVMVAKTTRKFNLFSCAIHKSCKCKFKRLSPLDLEDQSQTIMLYQ